MKTVIFAAQSSAVTERELRNREIAYRAAVESIVLLKNDGVLPMQPGKVALFGAGAVHTVKGGTGSGEVNERGSVSILDGLKQAGFEVATQKTLDAYESLYAKAEEEHRKKFRNPFHLADIGLMLSTFTPPVPAALTAEDLPDGTDTAIYVAARQAGEGADKRLETGDFDLTDTEKADLKLLTETYAKVIFVINSGAYMSLKRIVKLPIGAILFFCQQGMEGGRALADLLTGKENPSGRLTDTWARKYEDVPFGMEYSYLSGHTEYQEYKEGIFVGYRYFHTFGVKTRYPFGFGLSYTAFALKAEGAEADGETVTVPVTVTNTGTLPGKEVVQLYVSAPEGRLTRETLRLAAFGKTETLAPGASQTLRLTVPSWLLSSYDEQKAAYVLEAGDYVLRVGTSAESHTPAAILRLAEETVMTPCRNLCVPADPLEEMQAPARAAEDLTGVPVLAWAPAPVPNTPVEEEEDEKTAAVLGRLSAEDLAEVCVGEGTSGMMSTAGLFVPGAVGRTTSALTEKGMPNTNLADGPAGLRLLRESALSPKGKLKFVRGNWIMGSMKYFPGWLQKLMSSRSPKDRHLYQYTTAFPVATALAQTWNTDLAEQVGRAVSDEMQEYGVTWWLAPAMNIHRNPLCGRNFEYYSEDPLLSGRMAAAMTRGVESVPGCYVTLKHFACNNTEDDRTKTDSRLSERALREIYLKGFEIAVREAKPSAVMTGYNMINGVYAPNNGELLTGILRGEWGFDGVVMTDWFSTNKGQARNDLAIRAGNDMIMPGGKMYKAEILKGINDGSVSMDHLRRSAARIIRKVLAADAVKRAEEKLK